MELIFSAIDRLLLKAGRVLKLDGVLFNAIWCDFASEGPVHRSSKEH
jgi:hypothetical protein